MKVITCVYLKWTSLYIDIVPVPDEDLRVETLPFNKFLWSSHFQCADFTLLYSFCVITWLVMCFISPCALLSTGLAPPILLPDYLPHRSSLVVCSPYLFSLWFQSFGVRRHNSTLYVLPVSGPPGYSFCCLFCFILLKNLLFPALVSSPRLISSILNPDTYEVHSLHQFGLQHQE